MKQITIILSVFAFALCGLCTSTEALSVNFGPGINKEVKSLKDIREENVVKQSFDYSCGPASLATLLSFYFQDDISEEEIIKSLVLASDLKKLRQRKGFSLLDLKNFAKYKGYDVIGYRMDFEFLTNLDKPVLIPVNITDYAHFVIFRGAKGGRVFLADPSMGNMTMKIDRFLKVWQDGVGLVLAKSDVVVNENSPLQLSEEEKAIFSDPTMVKRLLGIRSMGIIYKSGEF